MNDFILFSDGMWCFETDLPLHEDKGGSYMKIRNPFAPMATFDPSLFERPKKPIINVYDFELTHNTAQHYGRDFSIPSKECKLRFLSNIPIAIGTSIDLIEAMGIMFHDTRVTEITFDRGEALYVGYPRFWIDTK